MQAKSFTLVGLVAAALSAVGAVGCGRTTDADRRASAKATAAAEDIAQEASLTSATLDATAGAEATSDRASRANDEVNAAFRLEQSDYRRRLRHALDRLDTELAPARAPARRSEQRLQDLKARRELLRADLDAVNRSTEQDWATVRTKVAGDLEKGRPGTQLAPRTDRTSGEAP